MTTCQICGRAIKTVGGRIAHHGYRRPGTGWQTPSCFGMGHLPYEQSRDAIRLAVREAHSDLKAARSALVTPLLHYARPTLRRGGYDCAVDVPHPTIRGATMEAKRTKSEVAA